MCLRTKYNNIHPPSVLSRYSGRVLQLADEGGNNFGYCFRRINVTSKGGSYSKIQTFEMSK